jgi:hypothetical protein
MDALIDTYGSEEFRAAAEMWGPAFQAVLHAYTAWLRSYRRAIPHDPDAGSRLRPRKDLLEAGSTSWRACWQRSRRRRTRISATAPNREGAVGML